MRSIQPHLATLLAATLLSGCMDAGEAGNLVPRTADEDASLPQLTFNGSTFHLEAFGDEDAPVVIVLHGGPGSDYRGLLALRQAQNGRRLEDDYRVIYWDQRGSGLSQRHDADELTIKAYDEDLDWLVEHFSPGRPVFLVGHSWGGMYATNYLSNHPDKVAGAVLIEPGPLTGALFEEIKDDIIKLDFFSEWLNDFTWAQTVLSPDDHARADFLRLAAILAADAQPGYGVSTEDISQFWRSGSVANRAIQDDGMQDGKGAWDFTTGLGDASAPVLLVASGNNSVLGEAFQERQQAFFRDAELIVIPDAGHEVPKTHPGETLVTIFNHLDAVGF